MKKTDSKSNPMTSNKTALTPIVKSRVIRHLPQTPDGIRLSCRLFSEMNLVYFRCGCQEKISAALRGSFILKQIYLIKSRSG